MLREFCDVRMKCKTTMPNGGQLETSFGLQISVCMFEKLKAWFLMFLFVSSESVAILNHHSLIWLKLFNFNYYQAEYTNA
ncbi:hypothetical protein BpHYR1_031408 [Brachionus plicatilis]|uniref:Uncharacterized protein n=1 Tax=Brachionus plicatilis TaxID=10195 RepID=A0A3M7QDI2_BRAPC|nr:hypothetical protein BpHYR1_031408 [Brachionus plicatilis]